MINNLRARRLVQRPQPPTLPHPVEALPQAEGATDWLTILPDHATFLMMAARDDVPGALGVREVKFTIIGADTPTPQLYFMQSIRNAWHFQFAKDHLGVTIPLETFNRLTYFTDQRHFVVGTIIAHESYVRPDGEQGLYALEFWPTDPVDVKYVAAAYHLVRDAMPFAHETLAYHPSGDVQEQLFVRQADEYAAAQVRTVSTGEIFEGISYSPLNLGVAVGKLRVMRSDDPQPSTPTDIVIYDTLPNDLPLVAGVISSQPQTALSHVNLRAQQNGIVNAYLRDAANDPALEPHIGKPIRLEITPDDILVTPVSTAEMSKALSARRPQQAQIPPRDLGLRAITALDDLPWSAVHSFGAKTTNLAELRRAISPTLVPNGFAVPFSFYHDFMTANGLYDTLQILLDEVTDAKDSAQPSLLKAFRRRIKDAPMPNWQREQLDQMHKAFPPGTTPRCRSSANNEDLVGFTGAGLYNSYTHRLDEGHIEKSIKQVWASLWTSRAFRERSFHRIDHMTAAMGVLVHPNFDDEQVNGVALTQNIYFPRFEGYFVNAQIGEDLVTNPEGDHTAEEVLVLNSVGAESGFNYETIYIRRSSLVGPNETVIKRDDLMLLTAQMKIIHAHFGSLYGRSDDDSFAMDIEFKVDRLGKLAIKQARPWVVF